MTRRKLGIIFFSLVLYETIPTQSSLFILKIRLFKTIYSYKYVNRKVFRLEIIKQHQSFRLPGSLPGINFDFLNRGSFNFLEIKK